MSHIVERRSAPVRCNNLSTRIADDADQHAANLTNWQQRYDQISAGQFQGRITELSSESLQVFHEYTSQQLHQVCNVWSDSIWLGIAAEPGSESRINGILVGDNELMCRPGDQEFELITPEQHDIYGIVVRQQDLIEAAGVQDIRINWQDFSVSERLAVPQKVMVDLRYLLNRLLRQGAALPGVRLQNDIIMMALLELLQCEHPVSEKNSSYKRRKRVVDRVISYIEAHKEQAVTITELCDQVGASRRTLQYSFESIVGISPVQYLRVTRLNGVRRSLLASGVDIQVADIATEWGFLHLSQFAKDYRNLFGELPSETRDKTLAA